MSTSEPQFIKSFKSYCHLVLNELNSVATRVSRNALGNTLYVDRPLLKGQTLTVQVEEYATEDEDKLKHAYCLSFGVSSCPPSELSSPTKADQCKSIDLLVGGVWQPKSLIRFSRRITDGSVEITSVTSKLGKMTPTTHSNFNFDVELLFVSFALHGTCTKLRLIELVNTDSLEVSPETFVSIDIEQNFINENDHDLDTYDSIDESELAQANAASAPITSEWLATGNVRIEGTIFTWHDPSQNGLLINQLPFRRLSFRIKQMVLSTTDFHELTFALVDAHNFSAELWPLVGSVAQLTKIAIDGISAGLEFSIEMLKDGKVVMCVDGQSQVIMRVNHRQLYYPLILLSGSVRQLEAISNEMMPCFGMDKNNVAKQVLTKLLRPLSMVASNSQNSIRRAMSSD